MFSQNDEEKVILAYFGAATGTFLDVGANDGIVLSNTRALALRGWKGVLVEPSPAAFEKLYIAYHGPDVPYMPVLVNAAIANHDGEIELYDSGTHLNKGDVALLSTTRPEELARWEKSGEQFTKIKVRAMTFATLLKHVHQSHFDFISIDAEGMDYDILRQIDLRAIDCRMLCVEYNQKDADKFTNYCVRAGMRRVHNTYENLIFAV